MDGIPHIVSLTVNGWTGVVTMFVLLGYMYSLGVWGGQYVRVVSQSGPRRRRVVNYTDEVRDWRTDVLLAVSVILSVALAVFGFAVRAGWMVFGFTGFAEVAGATVVIFALRNGLARFIAYIFGLARDGAAVWMMALNVVFGLLCLPLSWFVAGVANVNVAYLLLVILLSIGLIAEFVILVENFFTKTDTLFYIFLYLCAAEILPLAVGFRIITQVFN
ncbi:MAG: DUF4271 domain-containing protein [Paludibacteraceae bacterium]|nr:DUF4271 domain-containing protein [Candidatus Colousia faecequi]MCQ2338539.1 DUF4271 domain-containing protein [Paludibacteraceae bacterium]